MGSEIAEGESAQAGHLHPTDAIERQSCPVHRERPAAHQRIEHDRLRRRHFDAKQRIRRSRREHVMHGQRACEHALRRRLHLTRISGRIDTQALSHRAGLRGRGSEVFEFVPVMCSNLHAKAQCVCRLPAQRHGSYSHAVRMTHVNTPARRTHPLIAALVAALVIVLVECLVFNFACLRSHSARPANASQSLIEQGANGAANPQVALGFRASHCMAPVCCGSPMQPRHMLTCLRMAHHPTRRCS